jgi:hypothetical protein
LTSGRIAALLLPLFLGCNHGALDLGPTDGSAPVVGLADVARLCAIAASCGAAMNPPQALSASQCTGTVVAGVPDDPVTTRFQACAGATSCAALRACLQNDLLLLQTFAPNAACSGTAIVAAGRTYDCAGLGLVCVHELIGERAYCAAAACGPMFTSSCAGDTLERCTDNIRETTDCAAAGATCAAGQCVGAGAACDPSRSGNCAGTVATSCLGGRLATADCARQPLRTRCDGGRCVLPATARPCLVGNSMCSGTSAVICAAGEWQTVDCRALGFAGCAALGATNEVACR